MHKKSNFVRNAVQRIREKVPIKRWAKYLLVPAFLGAFTLSTYEVGRCIFKPRNDIYLNSPHGKVTIPEEVIIGEVRTSCCEVVFVKRASSVIAELSRLYGHVGGTEAISFGVPDDGGAHGISLIPIGKRTYPEQLEPWNFFVPEIRMQIEKVAISGDLEDRMRLLIRIKAGRSFEYDNPFGALYHKVLEIPWKDRAIQYLEDIATDSILRKTILERFVKHEEKSRNEFLDLIIHEATHAAQVKFKLNHGIEWPSSRNLEIMETFGYLAPIVYGDNPWIGLKKLLFQASLYYHIKVVGEPKEMKAKADALRPFGDILDRFLKEMDIKHPFQILDKRRDELRAAAKAVIDKESILHFGKPFEQIVPLDEIDEIKKQGCVYFDKLHKK